jgi:hypothetical protein
LACSPVTTAFSAPRQRSVLVGCQGKLGHLLPSSCDQDPVLGLQQPRSSYRHTRSYPSAFALQALYRPQDSLVAGLAEISMGFCLGVLWSESSVMITGCGPLNFSDALERICYQGVIVVAGTALFLRIVTRVDLATNCSDYFGELLESTMVQVKIAEYLSLLAVVGAFIALAVQSASGAQMDGMSGVDIELCRAIRDL